MARAFAVDVEKCSKCEGRMKLVALVRDPKSVAWRGVVRLFRLRSSSREPRP